ncbi:MAG: FtsX-like permease family protein [Limimaricola sp.]|uniref:ABC transporter permease n=1 Tax=Limimaricola sp. TaxID=2211665 RepID=UPI001D4D9A7F|nr:ABC transporter permease [Limimaricola sp.]MBI1415926.1 FtsX-like permease family protein [Limimaricola sp.]
MLWQTVRLAVQAIFRNALRSILTVLGVVIGVAAVIAMVTVGQGSTEQVTSDVAKLGTNLLMVRPGQAQQGPQPGNPASAFNLRDVEAIATQLASVRAAAPADTRTMTVILGDQNHATQVVGTDSAYLTARDIPVVLGRSFYESELRSGAAVCLLGQTVRKELFGSGDPLGQSFRIKSISCRVIGVMAEQGVSTFGTDQDDFVLIPIRTFQRRIAGNADVTMIYVSVRDGVDTGVAKSQIESLLRERRHIGPGEEDDFNVFDMKQVATILTGITAVLTGLLSAVAAVSLLVGGIGIMNIMLVSVTERTREIGIRLAIGAQEGQVLLQFLVEAIVLSLLGGLLGILLGLGLAAIAAALMKIPFSPNPLVILLAFGFSAAVGVVFGYFPARRAARLDPIEALRHQ